MTTQASRLFAGTGTDGAGATLAVLRPRRRAPRFPWALAHETAGGAVVIGAWVGLWWWFLAALG